MNYERDRAELLSRKYTKLSEEVSIYSQQISTSLLQLAQAYDAVNAAILGMPRNKDNNHIAETRLMENILLRGMRVLLSSLQDLKFTILKSIRSLIENATSIVTHSRSRGGTNCSEYKEINSVKLSIIENIIKLRKIEFDLSEISY